jgi:DNA invertase Pin-like site-specific DNA recombinase
MNVVYCRVAQKSEKALNYQKYQCTKFLESKGIPVSEFYIDNGFSGNNEDRPQLTKMIGNLDNIDSITVEGVDRLYRDLPKLLELFQLLKIKNIVLYDVSCGADVVNGNMIEKMDILGNLNKCFSDEELQGLQKRIVQNTKNKQEEIRKQYFEKLKSILSQEELEIWHYMRIKKLNNREISEKLGVSEIIIEMHINKIKEKIKEKTVLRKVRNK